MERVALVAQLSSVIGSGLMAGLFFAFSVAVLKALGRLPAAQAVAAMQSINLAILNPLFLLVFLGTAASCLLLAVTTLLADRPGDVLRLVGALLYVVGAFGVTVVRNVPLNNGLAVVDPDSADAVRLWERYLRSWTAWNHLRTVAATGAAVSLTLALP